MTEKKFQFAVNLPAMTKEQMGMRIMCVDMAEVGMNIKRLGEDVFYTIEEKMDGPVLTHEDLGRDPWKGLN
jgi:hypothetical protein